jgi:plasmid maintenance system antidote protein VapI
MKVKETIFYPYDLIKLAKQRGLTVTFLAKILGVSRNHLYEVNRNKVAISEEKFKRLKKILDIKYD